MSQLISCPGLLLVVQLVHGGSRGSRDYSFKCLLRDTLHIPGKSERPQSPEEVGNLFDFTKEARFSNLPFRRAGGLTSWGGETTQSSSA